MAEFMEVMRQARRLCAAHDGMCNYRNCPLDNGNECRLNIDLDGEDYNELERIIMDWAEEHPEPVYPSWKEAWQKLFPNACEVPCPRKCFDEGCFPIFICAKHDCDRCKARQMDPEIAEKLGIRPKEGCND